MRNPQFYIVLPANREAAPDSPSDAVCSKSAAFETPDRKMKCSRHRFRGTLGFGTKAMSRRENPGDEQPWKLFSDRAGQATWDSSEQGGCQRPAGRLTVTRIWERSIDVCEKEVKRESVQNRNICCAMSHRHPFVVVLFQTDPRGRIAVH